MMSEHFSNTKREDTQEQIDPQNDILTSPLHILLYGKECHRLESYSIVNSQQEQHHTYAYLSDGSALDDEEGINTDHYHFSSALDEAIGQVSHQHVVFMKVIASLWD